MKMKRVAIGELEGAALDWAAADSVGQDIKLTMAFFSNCRGGLCPWDEKSNRPYSPSKDWRQCGPLMDKYLFRIDKPVNGDKCWAQTHDLKTIEGGPTRLIAACRAIVASHNPDGYVEVPAELLEVV